MVIKKEISSFDEFDAWSGGLTTLNRLRDIRQDDTVFEYLESYLESCYDEMDETELNDFLWFEDELIKEWLGFDFWKYDSFDEAMEAKDVEE